MVSRAWLMWSLAAGLELAAVVAEYADSGQITWLFVGPAAFCLGMGVWTWRKSREGTASSR